MPNYYEKSDRAMNTPIFSIITVCYNVAETIEKTILSVRDQTYHNFDSVVVAKQYIQLYQNILTPKP